MSQTTKPAETIVSVPLSALSPNPNNPRAEITPESVRGLASSIDAVGLLQPLLVAPTSTPDAFVIRAGHRRFAALNLLGAVEVLVVVRPEGEDEGLEVALVENGQREGLDLFAEADTVRQILAKPGMTRDKAAELAGRSPKWIAKRARLGLLAPAVRSALQEGKEFALWPSAWIEEIALLAPNLQERLVLEEEGLYWAADVSSLEELRSEIGRNLRTLRHAMFQISDPALVPAAGSCEQCPKASHNQQAGEDLFGGYSDGDAGELEGSVCTDADCFHGKRAAVVTRKVEEARKKYGPSLLLAFGDSGPQADRALVDLALGDGESNKVLAAWAVNRTTREKGGVPTLYLTGKKAGAVVYSVQVETQRSEGTDATGKRTVERRLELLERRIMKTIIGELEDQVEDVDVSLIVKDERDLLRLVAAYGFDAPSYWNFAGEDSRDRRLDGGSFDREAQTIWAGVSLQILEALRNARGLDAADAEKEAHTVARAIGADWTDLLELGKKQNPTPKALQADVDAELAAGLEEGE
jgi:ParB family chromosome partitioning protein